MSQAVTKHRKIIKRIWLELYHWSWNENAPKYISRALSGENNRNFQQNFSLLSNPNKRHTLFDKFSLYFCDANEGLVFMCVCVCMWRYRFVLNRGAFKIGHVIESESSKKEHTMHWMECEQKREIIYLMLFARICHFFLSFSLFLFIHTFHINITHLALVSLECVHWQYILSDTQRTQK